MAGLLLTLAGCAGERTAGDWVNSVDAVCREGTRRVLEVPPAAGTDDLARDARERAEILRRVLGGIAALGRPEEVDELAHEAYLSQLREDIQVLETAARAARMDRPYLQLDVSASLAAIEVGLADCVVFSDTIAVMPTPGS